ncbi:MJ0042-type zinc finger domain-containing protein [Sphingomonas echinoides]|uniref:MJ0042-type zinc finger domain-containing protein n=1 Tax=Sphingomonas echinoides TaxID=59803 RepID=UPI002413544E|nr:zinc-ribbon domain-containing protein [Sphingomonas echinoides]
MILECTECDTRYVIPDSAVGPEGRYVRCANCKHSWFQEPVPALELDQPVEDDAPEDSTAAAPRESDAAPEIAAPISPTVPTPVEPTRSYTDYDAFAHQPPFRARRNPARRWTIAAVVAGVAMLGATAAIITSGAPRTAAALFHTSTETPLRLINKPIDRHDYNGNEVFAVSGTVLNPTDTRQRVPDIRADLLDSQRRVVFSWVIRPEATSLPPKGRVEFNSAKLDVPVNAKFLSLSFSGESAR